MTVEAGITLGILGMTLTIVGLFLAYYYGSKEKPKREIPNALKDLYDERR